MDPLKEKAALIVVSVGSAGGILGTLSAVAVRPPASRTEAWIRVAVGLTNAFVFTGLCCKYMKIDHASHELTLGVGFGLGFIGWFMLGTVSAILISLRAMAETKGVNTIPEVAGLLGKATCSWIVSTLGRGKRDDDSPDK